MFVKCEFMQPLPELLRDLAEVDCSHRQGFKVLTVVTAKTF